jgi:hypothetical protein
MRRIFIYSITMQQIAVRTGASVNLTVIGHIYKEAIPQE